MSSTGGPLLDWNVVSLAKVARIWQANNVSVIPILANQTKRPAIRWSPYQVTVPTLDEVNEWWGNGKPYGLALICGAVSGNLEMTEIEGRASTTENLTDIENRLDELGGKHVWELLTGSDGYLESSPSGGLHLLYRISDHEVPGNTKIANAEDGLVLAETRGHGGYVIVAPTPGICHPSGDSWDLISGQYGKLPEISWIERNLLHQALQLALGGPPPSPPQPAALPALITTGSIGLSAAGLSPGDDFEDHTDWAQILEPHGWTLESQHGTERHWTRPGKDRREGASATTGRANDRDRLYVFSTSTIFQAEVPYTKFGAYALLNHGNDYFAAAKALVQLGFGERREVTIPDVLKLGELVEEEETWHRMTDEGNAKHLWSRVRDRYRWVHQFKCFMRWDGRVWVEDHGGALTREFIHLTEDMHEHGQATLDTARCNWARQSQNNSRAVSVLGALKHQEGCTVGFEEFNEDRHLLNVNNGILNLRTQVLTPHTPARLMTRLFTASFDPSATCPQFEKFMESALPNQGMRTYVQRALGYSLLGDVDQRSIFWIYGPPGTGKSTLMDTMRCVFADYGFTAPAGAFRAKTKDQGPSNDLHGLRGKRFVTTSETAETTSFDEDLLKRLSGRDQITSRDLYQTNQEWTPECVLWMATNNAPRFTSDDDAIWRRTKLIPFLTVFTGDQEVPDYARKVLAQERDGILNWLLAGLADFQRYGLGEPASVREMATEHRAEGDSVVRFIDERSSDGILILGEMERIRSSELYTMYTEWTKQCGERPIGRRRFTNRVTSNFPDLSNTKTGGHQFWVGIGRSLNAGLLGLLPPSYLDS